VAYRRPEPLSRKHRLDEFTCGEPTLDEWLQRHARESQASDSARVYVTTSEDRETVVGYYALAAAQVAPQDATARALKGQPQARPVPAIVLARLAVDQRHQRAGLPRRMVTALASIGRRGLESPALLADHA
jgi:GNAT superfamily N-acetyltransferase